jgi:hypothetical protein
MIRPENGEAISHLLAGHIIAVYPTSGLDPRDRALHAWCVAREYTAARNSLIPSKKILACLIRDLTYRAQRAEMAACELMGGIHFTETWNHIGDVTPKETELGAGMCSIFWTRLATLAADTACMAMPSTGVHETGDWRDQQSQLQSVCSYAREIESTTVQSVFAAMKTTCTKWFAHIMESDAWRNHMENYRK